MKMRTIKLTAQTLTDALQGKTAPAPNLPPDTELLDIKFDLLNNEVIIIVRSDSSNIPEKYPIPELNITTATYTKLPSDITPANQQPKVEPSRSHKHKVIFKQPK